MRRLLLLAVVWALVACSSAAAAPVFYVWGHGWGHGIGMPQYGAYGYALHGGKSYTWILDHYYTGTQPGTASKTTIRVLLDVGRSSVTLNSPGPWTVADGRDRSWQLAAGSRTIGSDLRVSIHGQVRQLVAPVTFSRAGGAPLSVDGDRYRGFIVLRKPGSRLAIVNRLGLQSYLKGVVPDEMPPAWHMEALKAQAVAARSYGLANLTTGTYFDVYDDTRDQVYGGVGAEHPRSSAAIDATANEVRTYNGSLATTFFYSSSGGWTAANEDVWGSAPVPYLRSVRDFYDTISPYHNWGPTRYTRAAMDATLGLYAPGALWDIRTTSRDGRRVNTVTVVGSGGTRTLSGSEMRTVAGLRSTWFRIGVLNLVREQTTVVYGSRAGLTGRARSVGNAWLETRRPGGAWEKLRDLVLTSEARFTESVRPLRPREYRVRSARGASDPRLVRVATKVLFAAPDDRTGLSGIVRPRRAGLTVTIQRLEDGSWTRVKQGTTDAAGDFSIAFPVTNGTYRARATAPGLLRGVSPILKVVG